MTIEIHYDPLLTPEDKQSLEELESIIKADYTKLFNSTSNLEWRCDPPTKDYTCLYLMKSDKNFDKVIVACNQVSFFRQRDNGKFEKFEEIMRECSRKKEVRGEQETPPN